jgi:hypothetical protein
MKLPKAVSVSLIAAKCELSSFSRSCKAKQERAGEVEPRQKHLKRPEWVIKSGEAGHRNGRHCFTGDFLRCRAGDALPTNGMAAASQAWSHLSPDSKSGWSRRAKSDNSVTKRLKEDALRLLNVEDQEFSSPWNVSQGAPFPLPESAVQAVLDARGGVRNTASRWVQLGRRHAEDPEFPDELEYHHILKVRRANAFT